MADASRVRAASSEAATSCKVIRFPSSSSSSDSATSGFLLDVLILDPNVRSDFQALVEGIVFDLLARGPARTQAVSDNPFGSVYLADLAPDPILPMDRELLERLIWQVEDRSESFTIDDGLED